MFYNQPLSVRFGTELLQHVDQTSGIETYWDRLDVAVAWVRASGMAYLSNGFVTFLRNGGHLSFVVGIDLKNTTREGLQALLDLEAHGVSETYVYHNEAGSIFHPKLYLFRNEEEARLIVGSNNLTAAGLYVNVEAGLQVDADVEADVIAQAADALDSWRDTSTSLTIKLDSAFLAELSKEGYVIDEAASRAAMQGERVKRASRGGSRLFGSRSYAAPPRTTKPQPTGTKPSTAGTPAPTGTGSGAQAGPGGVPAAPGTVLLMRLRKASTTDRPTQTQIPFRVADTFFKGVTSVRSTHSGDVHGLNDAQARGTRNTIKLEIPEMRNFTDPVARFEKTAGGVDYEVHDVGTPKGNQIMVSLQSGLPTGDTQSTVSDVTRATLWRYI